MASARRSIEVDVPPDRFFEVVRDYARYPEFLPEVKAVRVGPRTGNSVEVTYRLDARIKLIEFTLLHVETRPSRIEWRLVRGDLMKRDEGRWTLDPTPGGGTTATYAIELELLPRVPRGLEKALAEQGLPAMLANFKSRAESMRAG
ncbi:MAG TPA: SRPBCC family protein [Myxococcales bacterium]|nr:SRPBCC family protein [Myxococcales bacterium]